MKVSKLLTGIIISFLLSGCGTAEVTSAPASGTEPEKEPPVEERTKIDRFQIEERTQIDRIFESYDSNNAPGCATAVYQNGDTLFSKGYGIANLDYGIPISDSTAFYMTSLSKQMTAAAAGLLVVRGELDPNLEVSEYIDDWPDWAAGVKVEHLFSHTSGLPDVYDLMSIHGISISNVMDLDDYMTVVKMGESLVFGPGSKYAYNNSDYTALAYLIEKISGEKFSQYVDQELFGPLGMHSTHFHDDRHHVVPNRAMSYEKSANGFRQTYLGNFQGVGPGGLYSTINDWHRWESFWNGNLEWNGGISADEAIELKRMMTTPYVAGGDPLDYGMGLQINTRKGTLENGHSGSFMGFQTDYRRYPQYGIAMVTLCNRADGNPQQLNNQMADILLKEHFEAYLSPYKGTYRSEELSAEFKVTIEGGKLKLNRRLSPKGFMTETGKDKWSAESLDMVFKRNGSGEVSSVLLSTSRALDVEFHRKNE
ncbi:MAG: serine hydrolase domain-containing protein [Balneolales bacterium]